VHDAADVFRGAAKEKGVRLQIQLPGDLPDVTADTVQIGQVFANLLSNALKYTPAGGEISIFAETLLDHVWFIIADTGRGIPADYQPYVFDRFFRVPGQENQSGTGLGLAIVKDIVQAHGGTVKVESTVGKGSTFMFTLPLAAKVDGKGTQA
jgi:signal transduction histidine kinase